MSRKGLTAAILLAAVALLLAMVFTAQGADSTGKSLFPALLVLNKSDNTLAIVDPKTLKVVGTVPTGSGPHEVAVSRDGRTAYVTNYGGNVGGKTLSVIDLISLSERKVELGLERPHGILEHGGMIYLTTEGSQAVARYNPEEDRVDWVARTRQEVSHMLVITPDGKKIYTSNMGSNTVSVVPVGAESASKQIPVGRTPEGIAISPDGQEVWVAHRGDGDLSIIDTNTDEVKQKLSRVGEFPIRVEFAADGKRVLISDAQAGALAVYDAASREEIQRIPVGGIPVGIQLSEHGSRAYVAATGSNKVFVVDLGKLEVAGSIEPGNEPDGMAWARE